jgi:ureidoacrylate peracid hydrolase
MATRGSEASYRLKGESGTAFPPDSTALLVIDTVNDFLSEGGAGYDMAKRSVEMVNVVENLKRLLEGARERSIPVLHGPMAYTEEDYAVHELHRRSTINRVMFERKMFLAGTWGADFHPDLRPSEGEIVLLPHKSVDVFETDLPEHLERLGTTHLVIAGMTANLCCESTGRHAMERGYDVTFISDAIGAENIPAYEAAVHVNYPLISNGIMKVDEFLAAVDASPGRNDVQPGDMVHGSDHGEIGKVEEVVQPGADGEGHMLVRRGMILQNDTYIPLGAVVKRAGTDVFINVPKLIVGKMPWGEPASPESQRQKYGRPAASVEKLYGTQAPGGGKR